MEVELAGRLSYNPRLFEQILSDPCSGQLPVVVHHFNVLAEPRAVVVQHGLCIAKGFQQGLSLQDLLLDGGGVLPTLEREEMIQQELGRFGLASLWDRVVRESANISR